ncbi:MAG: arylesterase [Thiotrichaceae bacterium]|nr:MAG: arylesterase [Thiotrichaceae bacterium]
MKPFTFNVVLSMCLVSIVFALSSCSNEVPLHPLKSNATILAFGDSLTYGTGARRDKAYPAVLERITGLKVINAGIPGEISAAGLTRLPALLKQHQPDLIIICHGGNDILRKMNRETTRDNIQQMINLARHNNSQVVLIGVPEFGLFLKPAALYPALAETNKLPIANEILSDILGNLALKADRIHPNTKGYQMLAERINSLLIQSGALSANE